MADTIDAALREATRQLSDSSDTPALDARLLFEHVLAVNTAWLVVHGCDTVADSASQTLTSLIERRRAGEPIAYLTGHTGFWSIDLVVDSRVLVPRGDTETLVEAALEVLPADRPLEVVDMGTGSGAIALALATERPGWQMSATDASATALRCAQANAARLGLARVDFRHGSWFDALAAGRRFDAILSNPPYIAANDAHLSAAELAYEPQDALVSADNGLADLRTLISGARERLSNGGWLILEHGYDQAEAVAGFFVHAGYTAPRHWRDLGGITRVTGAQLLASTDSAAGR